jgi:hypothetical protein
MVTARPFGKSNSHNSQPPHRVADLAQAFYQAPAVGLVDLSAHEHEKNRELTHCADT